MGEPGLRSMEELSKVRTIFRALYWMFLAITCPSAPSFLGSWTLLLTNSCAGRGHEEGCGVGGRSTFGQMFWIPCLDLDAEDQAWLPLLAWFLFGCESVIGISWLLPESQLIFPSPDSPSLPPMESTYPPGPLPLSSCCFVPGNEKPSTDSSRNWHVGKPNCCKQQVVNQWPLSWSQRKCWCLH